MATLIVIVVIVVLAVLFLWITRPRKEGQPLMSGGDEMDKDEKKSPATKNGGLGCVFVVFFILFGAAFLYQREEGEIFGPDGLIKRILGGNTTTQPSPITSQRAEEALNKGNVLFDVGQNEEALEAYLRAVEIRPDYADAWEKIGVTLRELGRYEKAIKADRRAAEAWNNKGVSLRRLGRYEEALRANRRAVEIKPDYAKAWYGKGYSLRRLGRDEEALRAFERAYELDPSLR